MAKEKGGASSPSTVRVRAKPGARLIIGRENRTDIFAPEGEWIDFPAKELEIAAIRRLVETEEDVAQAKKDESVKREQHSRGIEIFESQRRIAREQAETSIATQKVVTEKNAQATLDKKQSEVG